jgi:hypothetical protein
LSPPIVAPDQPVALLLPLVLVLALIATVASAVVRSARRLHCAQLRDELVDAARAGEINVADYRVFALIDWFDQVASTGRKPSPGRHAGKASIEKSPVATSLASAVGPGSPLGPGGPFWPYRQEDGEEGGSDIYERALNMQRQLTRRRRSTPAPAVVIDLTVPKIIDLTVVTGHAKPKGALMPVSGSLPLLDTGASSSELPLKERIFAVVHQP